MKTGFRLSELEFLTLDDLEPEGKRILVRVDINTPVDTKTGRLIERTRMEEAAVTLRALGKSKVVVCSHQGRVGEADFVPLEEHSRILSEVLGRDVRFVDDVMGPAARREAEELNDGEVLLLDNLRFMSEETQQYGSVEEAARTYIVQRLWRVFDGFVLDAFPTAHRAHPSIIGFPYYLPTAAGVLVMKELKQLQKLEIVQKGPFTAVLGGSKVRDRLEALEALLENRRADKVLVTGVLALVFLKAAGRYQGKLNKVDDAMISKAKELLQKYPPVIEMPKDMAIQRDGARVELPVGDLPPDAGPLDIGSRTIREYSKIIRSSGTVFMSGPPGAFEIEGFDVGTRELLQALASSFGTTIVSGGHLSTALDMLGLSKWIDHVSSAGGALIQALAGKELPLLRALEYSARKMREGGYAELLSRRAAAPTA
ncbi:MAG: phosphoglycerate kinase [Nitrososphaeria archaeon]